MSQASIIINVSDAAHTHNNGVSGIFTVPGKKDNAEFGMLVVYPGYEIQDQGDQRKTITRPEARAIANDIVGLDSDAAAHTLGSPGTKAKWGLLIAEAQPDVPRELLEALQEETAFLNQNPPDVKMRPDSRLRINVAVNIEADSVKQQKVALSERAQTLRAEFEAACGQLVQKAEIKRANEALAKEDGRLIMEADQMWAQGEESRKNINELHQGACRRFKMDKPWCYTPQQLVDCPGCGGKIKENVLYCASCNGRLFKGVEVLRKMKPEERAAEMYPDLVGEPVSAGDPRPRSSR